MNVQHLGQGAFLFDTEGDEELLSRNERSHDEQTMDREAEDMVRSWDISQLNTEASEYRNKFAQERGTFENDYYEGDQEFDELKKDMEEPYKDTLWIKKEVSNPTGKEINGTSTIQFDRIGYLEFNPIPVESTIHDGKPTIMSINDSLMPGLILGLLLLREGESAYLLISPKSLFGAMGAPPTIPPHAYMLYYVRIHKVWDESDMESMRDYARLQNFEVPLQDKIEFSTQHKEAANKYLADNKPKEALVRYKAALRWIEESPQEELEKSIECKKLVEILFQNTAITLNKLEMYKSATKAAKAALGINAANVKAIYSLAKARMGLGDFSKALQILDHGKKVAPDNTSLRELRARLDAELRDERVKRDEIMLRMSKAAFWHPLHETSPEFLINRE